MAVQRFRSKLTIAPVRNTNVIRVTVTSVDPQKAAAAANAVAEAIRDLVFDYMETHPGIRYMVIVGNDTIIPFYRVPDAARLANEAAYHAHAGLRDDHPSKKINLSSLSRYSPFPVP